MAHHRNTSASFQDTLDSPSPQIAMVRLYAFSRAIRDLDVRYIEEYMREGGNPNQPMVFTHKYQTPPKDYYIGDKPRNSELCGEHALSFLIRNPLPEGFVENETNYDRLERCAYALLGKGHGLHSDIEYIPDHFGFSPADYAACSVHTQLAVDIILDKMAQDIARGRPLPFAPDYHLLALAQTDIRNHEQTDTFVRNANDVLDAVCDNLDQIIERLAKTELKDTDVGFAQWDYYRRARQAWNNAFYDLDVLSSGHTPTKTETMFCRLRKGYNTPKPDHDKRDRKYLEYFRTVRAERLNLR